MVTSWEQIAGQWKQLGGKVKQQWGKLTDDEFVEISGNRDILSGKIQEKYGIAKEEADTQIDKWAHEEIIPGLKLIKHKLGGRVLFKI